MTLPVISQEFIDSLKSLTKPEELLAHLFGVFKERIGLGTSGQLTGVVMIDMLCKQGIKPRVFTLDTQKLFKETYQLFHDLERTYQIEIERITPDPIAVKNMVAQNGEFLFFDSKEKQELCCQIRKVEPNQRVLKTLDVWVTGLRVDQFHGRQNTPRLRLIEEPQTKRSLLKVAPLIDWTEKQLRDYMALHQVPLHPLLAWEQEGWRYESLGCRICTTPIGPFEPRRAGRWRWFNAQDPQSKECGLHVDNSNTDDE